MFNSAVEYVANMGVGFTDDSAKTNQGRQYHQKTHYQAYKDKGLGHLRIRVVDDLSPELITDIKEAVDDALEVGLLPVLAYGGGKLETEVSPENYRASLTWWETIASTFNSYDNRLSFNLLIEIGSQLSQNRGTINQFYYDVIKYVRELGQHNRVIFCAPALLSDPKKLKFLVLPENDNFIGVEIHDYAAGAKKWNIPDDWKPIEASFQQLFQYYRTDARYWNDADLEMREPNRQRIRDTIKLAKDWGIANNKPMYWGALLPTNPNNNNLLIGGDYSIDEQVEFVKFFAQELRLAGIPVAFNSDTKYFDRVSGQWISDQVPVVDAMFY